MKISLLRFSRYIPAKGEPLTSKKPENGDFENVTFSECNITFLLHSKCNIRNECNKKVEYAFDYVTFCVRTSFSVFSPISRIFFIFFYLEKFSHFKDFFHRNFIMIHYDTLCYILCYIMLHYVTLCYIQCYIMLHYIILHS